MVNRQDKENPFKWDRLVKNLPGTTTYEFCWPWVYTERSDRIIAADIFVYFYNGRPIGPTEEVCWEASSKWGSTCSWLGIQDAYRKV